MKTLTYLLVILLSLAVRLPAQEQEITVLESSYNYRDSSGVLLDNTRSVYFYDGRGNLIITHYQMFNGSSWITAEEWLSYFNSKNQEYETLSLSWRFGVRDTTARSFISYNQNGDVTEIVTQQWNQGFYNYTREFYIYNKDGNLDTLYTYRATNNKWDYNTLKIYSENMEDSTKTVLIKYYDEGVWINQERTITKFDDTEKILETLTQSYYDTTWSNFERYVYVYDSTGTLTERLRERWKDGWQSYVRYKYEYNSEGLTHSVLFQYWINSEWKDYIKTVYNYKKIIINSIFETSGNEFIKVFPNPASDYFFIDIPIISDEPVFLEITDIAGNVLINKNYEAGISGMPLKINASGIPTGIFFIRLKPGKKRFYYGMVVVLCK